VWRLVTQDLWILAADTVRFDLEYGQVIYAAARTTETAPQSVGVHILESIRFGVDLGMQVLQQ
jgi:hypothetical protein